MTTATMKRPEAEWRKLLQGYTPGETMEELIDRFVDGDDDRLSALYDEFRHNVETNEFTNDFACAILTAGNKGPAAAIAEFWRQISHGQLIQMLEKVASEIERDAEKADDKAFRSILKAVDLDTPSEPPAPVSTNGHHAQDDAADDEGDADEDNDDDEVADDPDAIGRGVTGDAISPVREIAAALNAVDGLPLWDDPNATDRAIEDAGYRRAFEAVSYTLTRSIQEVCSKLPLSEKGKIISLVMQHASPHLPRDFQAVVTGKPFDSNRAAEVLTNCGVDAQAVLDALGLVGKLEIEIDEPIDEVLTAHLDPMPLEARARLYKLVYLRATHWRENVARDERKEKHDA